MRRGVLSGSRRGRAVDDRTADGQYGGLRRAPPQRMLKVGLTGGMACGKTFVGETLAGKGCLVIQADELGHEVLAPGGAAYEAVIGEFGRDILAGDGSIDRRAL